MKTKTKQVVGRSVTASQSIYFQMKREVKSAHVRFMIKSGWAKNKTEAKLRLDAAIQWLAGHAVKRKDMYVMLEGDVDDGLHTLILHTKWYANFCEKHIGFFIHHTPLDADMADKLKIQGAIKNTVDFLIKEFGEELNPLLRNWKKLSDKGLIAVTDVSCVGNGYDD
jgi:hypothetical protein